MFGVGHFNLPASHFPHLRLLLDLRWVDIRTIIYGTHASYSYVLPKNVNQHYTDIKIMEVIYLMLVLFSCWFYIYGTKQVNEAAFSHHSWWVASCVIWHSAQDVWDLGGVIRRVNKHQTASLNLSCCFIRGDRCCDTGCAPQTASLKQKSTSDSTVRVTKQHPFFKQKSPGCYL